MSVMAEGKFNFADVWDGTMRASRRAILVLSTLGVLSILLGVWLGLQRNEGWARGKVLLGLGVFWLIYLWPFLIYRTRATLKRTPSLQGNVRFQFDESGYTVETMHAHAEVKWGALSKSIETGKSFLLYQNPKIGSVVPKRFFQSAADVETLREFLRTGVPRK